MFFMLFLNQNGCYRPSVHRQTDDHILAFVFELYGLTLCRLVGCGNADNHISFGVLESNSNHIAVGLLYGENLCPALYIGAEMLEEAQLRTLVKCGGFEVEGVKTCARMTTYIRFAVGIEYQVPR